MATSMLSNIPYISPESAIRMTSPHMSDSMAAGSFHFHEKQLLPVWYHAIIAREIASAMVHAHDTRRRIILADAVVAPDAGCRLN
jgi:hypothetical protein